MNHTSEAIRIADCLDQNVQIEPQTSEDEPGGYRSELDELMADAAAILRSQHTRIAELEAQLYAVGAGGVGRPMPEPQLPAAAQHAPVAWAIFSKDGTAMVMWSRDMPCAKNTAEKLGLPLVALYTAPQPAENLRCKSTQKRLATLWGYEKACQPLPVEAFTALAHRIASKYTHRSDPSFCGYAFLPHTLEQFVRAIEVAHGITGGQK